MAGAVEFSVQNVNSLEAEQKETAEALLEGVDVLSCPANGVRRKPSSFPGPFGVGKRPWERGWEKA